MVTRKWFFGHCYVENPILSFVPHQKISEKHFLECPHQTNSRTMTWSRNSFDLTFPYQAKESVTREDSISVSLFNILFLNRKTAMLSIPSHCLTSGWQNLKLSSLLPRQFYPPFETFLPLNSLSCHFMLPKSPLE